MKLEKRTKARVLLESTVHVKSSQVRSGQVRSSPAPVIHIHRSSICRYRHCCSKREGERHGNWNRGAVACRTSPSLAALIARPPILDSCSGPLHSTPPIPFLLLFAPVSGLNMLESLVQLCHGPDQKPYPCRSCGRWQGHLHVIQSLAPSTDDCRRTLRGLEHPRDDGLDHSVGLGRQVLE